MGEPAPHNEPLSPAACITTYTMAATSGHLPQFNPTHPELWETIVEQLKYFILFQGITDADKKKVLLLSACGITTLQLVQGLVTPNTLEASTYEDLLKEYHPFALALPPFKSADAESATAGLAPSLQLATSLRPSGCNPGDRAMAVLLLP
ncbi:UNVERIFIED_CONTAM: hypothetical protein K2H54_049386 [Gekko kuhli]